LSEINYRVTTTALGIQRPTRYSPESGIINSAIIHFPAGCQQLVEVVINKRTEQILPTPVKGGTGSIGIALEDTTQSFDVKQTVEQNDPIEVVIKNHDSANPHTISVVVLIAKTETYAGP